MDVFQRAVDGMVQLYLHNQSSTDVFRELYMILGDGLQQLDSYAELSKSYSFEDMNLDTLEFLRKDC